MFRGASRTPSLVAVFSRSTAQQQQLRPSISLSLPDSSLQDSQSHRSCLKEKKRQQIGARGVEAGILRQKASGGQITRPQVLMHLLLLRTCHVFNVIC